MFSGSPFSGLAFADSGGFLYAASTADLASVTDSIDGVKQQGGVVVGNLSLSDTYSPTGVYNISAFDTATVADAAYPLGSFEASVSERARAVIVRQIGGGFSSGAMSSGPFSALGDFTREVPSDEVFSNVYSQSFVANSVSVADLIRTNAVMTFGVSEDVSASDVFTNLAVINSLTTNIAVATDTTSSYPEYPRTVQETATGDDAISSIPIYAQFVNESAVGSDAISTLVELVSTVVNEAQASELATTLVVVNSAVNNLVSGADAPRTNIIVQSQCIELSHAVDGLVARRYWENINTAESAGWRLVQNNIGID
jgi:hypothetical protein